MDQSAPIPTPFEQLGARPAIERIVNHFYDLMDSDPAYTELRAMHGTDLSHMKQALSGFLTGWAGGPRDWFDANPGKCMMSMHAGLPITRASAQQWVQAMQRAFADCDLSDHPVALLMNERFRMMAGGMAQADLDESRR